MKPILLILSVLLSFVARAQNSYSFWVEKSANFIENNRPDSAVFALQNAMALEPANKNNTVLLLGLGILQCELQMYDDAYISLTAALVNNSTPELVLHHRASLLCHLGRFEEAMEDYNAILAQDVQNVEAYYRRGLLFLEKNNRTQAETDFKTAQNIDVNSLFAKLSKALMYKIEENWPAAEKIYSEIIKNSPNPASVLYLDRAECYVNSEQFSKAAVDLRAVEKTERDNPFFYVLQGRVRLSQYDNWCHHVIQFS